MRFAKKILAIAAAFSAVGVIAAPVALPGGPLYIQYTNIEQVKIDNTIGNTSSSGKVWSEGNWGLLEVSTIFNGKVTDANANIGQLATNIFTNSLTANITGIFYGVNFSDATHGYGGYIDLYWDEAGLSGGGTMVDIPTATTDGISGIATKRTAQDQYTGFTDGIFLVRLQFQEGVCSNVFAGLAVDPGCKTGAQGTTVISSSDPSQNSGFATSYQSVVKGATDQYGNLGLWEGSLDGDWFTKTPTLHTPLIKGSQDAFTKSNYDLDPSWSDPVNGITGVSSSDPVRVFALPEPDSVALVGAALIGLGALRRRRG